MRLVNIVRTMIDAVVVAYNSLTIMSGSCGGTTALHDIPQSMHDDVKQQGLLGEHAGAMARPKRK